MFTVSDFKKILKGCKEKISDCKADLFLWVYVMLHSHSLAEVTASFCNQVSCKLSYLRISVQNEVSEHGLDLRGMPL